MAIRFSCSGCGKTLSVPDDAAGKKARCPDCSTVVDVPEQTGGEETEEYTLSPPEMDAPVSSLPRMPSQESPKSPGAYASGAAKPTSASENPYASPSAETYEVKDAAAGGTTPIQPTPIEFGEVFSDAWNVYTNNIAPVLLAALPVFIFNAVSGYALQIAAAIASAQSEELGLIVFWVGYFVVLVLGTFLGIGQTIVLLDVARGRPTSPERFFSAGRYLLWIILGGIAFMLMVYIGMALCIVPGVILALMFGQFYFLMIDRELDFGDAFTTSKNITEGNKLTLFGIAIVAGLIAMGSCLVLCVPALFFIPYCNMIYVIAYLKMSGQPIAGLKGPSYGASAMMHH